VLTKQSKKNAADGLQMSDSWLTGETKRRDGIFESVNQNSSIAKNIRNSLTNGHVEKWLVHTDSIGGVTVWVLDKVGKFIPDQQAASKILQSLP